MNSIKPLKDTGVLRKMMFNVDQTEHGITLTGHYSFGDPELFDVVDGLSETLEPLLTERENSVINNFKLQPYPDHGTRVARFLFLLESFIDVDVTLVNYQPEQSDETQVALVESLSVTFDSTSRRYSSKSNFYASLDRLTGQSELNSDRLSEVLSMLRDYFQTHDHKQTIQCIFRALKVLKVPLYDSAHLIAHHLWNRPLIKIDNLGLVNRIYDYTQHKYLEIRKSTNRKSNINIPFRIFKTLERAGLAVDEKDFKLPTTKRSLLENKKLWEIMIADFLP